MSAHRSGMGLGPGFTEGVKYLLIWNGIVYLLQHFIITFPLFGKYSFAHFFGLVPHLVLTKFFIWQPVTYMFLHAQSFFHILFNMFVLWMFGGDIERVWGTRRFVTYYFFCGTGAGLLTMLFTPHSHVATIGASGAVYGILLAFAFFFPERRIYLYMLFPVSARVFVLIMGVIAFLSSISQPGDGIAHLAHLGGLVFGWIYIKWAGALIDRYTAKRRRSRFRVIDFKDPDEFRRK